MSTTTITTTITLTPSQMQFCKWLYEDGNTNPHTVLFARNYLRTLAIKNGMKWAPAWIVKDKSRVTTRGMYRVPELINYIELVNIPANAGNAT
jgi:hypothetical protein